MGTEPPNLAILFLFGYEVQYKEGLKLRKAHFCLGIQLHIPQCIFDFEIRKKQMFTEARAFSRVTYFLFSGEPAGFFS